MRLRNVLSRKIIFRLLIVSWLFGILHLLMKLITDANLDAVRSRLTLNNNHGRVELMLKNVDKSFQKTPLIDMLSAKVITLANQNYDKQNRADNESKPCFTPYTISVDDELKHIFEEKRMLSYFNIDSQYLISVPRWQKDLAGSTSKVHTKNYIAAVLRVRLYADDPAKWTIRELKQWMHYQFWAGIEHIYICNHYLKESERIDPHLTEYIHRGLVTVYPWNNITSIPGSKTYVKDNIINQVECYNYVLDRHRDQAVWFHNMDMDESPYVPLDTCEGFLTRFLNSVNEDVTELQLSNVVFQGQGDRSRDIYYDRLNRVFKTELSSNVKPIYRVAMTLHVGINQADTKGTTAFPEKSEIYVIHYWGARNQHWQNDTADMREKTVEFNNIRTSIAVNIRHSLISFGEFDAFATNTGP